ncbi:MAG: hypothetical protein ACYDH4_13230, partial [Candidatus Cryosericum sp.]
SPEQPNPPADVPPTIEKPETVSGPVSELAPSERPSQPAESIHVTMRYANNLLEDSRFEEALQAFLELSRRS